MRTSLNSVTNVRRLNLIASWSMAVLSGLCLLALFASPFVPSPLMVTIAIWSAAATGLFYAAFAWGLGGFGWSEKSDRAIARHNIRWLEKRYLRAPFVGIAFFCMAWLGFGSGLPWLVTAAIGHDGEMSAVVSGWEHRSARTCTRPRLAHLPPLMIGPRALCLDENREAAMPPGTTVRLIGQVSALGISPTSVQKGKLK